MSKKIHEDIQVLLSLKKLIDLNMSANDYTIVYLMGVNEVWKLSKYMEAANLDITTVAASLIERGYIKKTDETSESLKFSNLEVTNVLKDLLNGKEKDENVENWITDWYELWPTGIKSGGYYLKTDKKGSLRKMKNFLVNNPEYTRDLIMKATQNYLLEQSIKGYSYTKLAPYFIIKDGISVLAGECEVLENNLDLVDNQHHQVYGDNEL
jgi:hypothetical protein